WPSERRQSLEGEPGPTSTRIWRHLARQVKWIADPYSRGHQPGISSSHDGSSASMTAYPRDLVGYADQPPDPRWPGGARLVLNFVINYEEGGERSVLHGDKVAETRLTDLLMPGPLQGARDLDMESAYEYGSRVGFWRLMRIFAERQVIPTIYAVGMALERNPQGAEAMARQGCDVVDH